MHKWLGCRCCAAPRPVPSMRCACWCLPKHSPSQVHTTVRSSSACPTCCIPSLVLHGHLSLRRRLVWLSGMMVEAFAKQLSMRRQRSGRPGLTCLAPSVRDGAPANTIIESFASSPYLAPAPSMLFCTMPKTVQSLQGLPYRLSGGRRRRPWVRGLRSDQIGLGPWELKQSASLRLHVPVYARAHPASRMPSPLLTTPVVGSVPGR